MPSNFPRQQDIFAFLTPANVDSPVSNAKRQAPADLLVRLGEALLAIQRHVGFSLQSAGDKRVDGTVVTSGLRTLRVLEGRYLVSESEAGSFALHIPWKTLFSSASITGDSPVASPSEDILAGNTAPVLRTQSPVSIDVTRTLSQLTEDQTRCYGSLITGWDGEAKISVCTQDIRQPFGSGENLLITLRFWGGI